VVLWESIANQSKDFGDTKNAAESPVEGCDKFDVYIYIYIDQLPVGPRPISPITRE
jgi:hypothetical protein